ncbi:hypothetical protein, partial [Pseudomonas nitroreducens]|uniref:hypothetical protein n=1 Tax=Pseudomonas nitroreducens TaxID=46680 RepID=UPI001F44BA66
HVRVGHRQASNFKAPDQRKLVGGFVFGEGKILAVPWDASAWRAALSLKGEGTDWHGEQFWR